MNARKQTRQPKPRRRRRPVSVSRVRATAIARGRVARAMIECEVSDRLPERRYGRPLPKNCWYVRCGSRLAPKTTGGASIIVCISKRSGRVLRIEAERGE